MEGNIYQEEIKLTKGVSHVILFFKIKVCCGLYAMQ